MLDVAPVVKNTSPTPLVICTELEEDVEVTCKLLTSVNTKGYRNFVKFFIIQKLQPLYVIDLQLHRSLPEFLPKLFSYCLCSVNSSALETLSVLNP